MESTPEKPPRRVNELWTDGRATLEEMAAADRERGYEYIAITDHSKALAMANGLDERRSAHPCLGQVFIKPPGLGSPFRFLKPRHNCSTAKKSSAYA
jgi:hypothetical protein